MTEVLSVKQLAVAFGGKPVVKGVSFDLQPGKTFALVGESGSGKSLTAFSILGLLPNNATVSGEVRLAGRELLALPKEDLRLVRGAEVSIIVQNPLNALNPVMRVGEQIVETLRRHQPLTREQACLRAIELIGQVRIHEPEKTFSLYPHNLSGGMRQRVMIAMAIACSPKVLIADEPTTALDPITQLHVLKLLHDLRDELGMALMIITHDLGLVRRWADTVAVMQEGLIVESAPASELFDDPQHAYTQALLAAAQHVRMGPEPKGVDHSAEPSPPLLMVENLVVDYAKRGGSVPVLKGVGFSLMQGESLGLVGESGSGKSTLSRAIMGLTPISQGDIRLRGQPAFDKRGSLLPGYRSSVQMVFQDPYASLNPRQTVLEIVQLPLRVQGRSNTQERQRRVEQALDMVHLSRSLLGRYPHELSGGQRQRVSLARALISRPEVLICDEPLAALDVSIQAQILDLLIELRRDLKTAFLFISHDLSLVASFADRILVMRSGSVVEEGPSWQIWHQPAQAYSQQLIAASMPLAA